MIRNGCSTSAQTDALMRSTFGQVALSVILDQPKLASIGIQAPAQPPPF